MQPAPIAIVIPAYKPSAGLIDLVAALSTMAEHPIVVVDDGSGEAYRDIFSRVAAFPQVQLLRHAVNLGKGAALKTAMNHVLCRLPDVAGIVTADADGQHHPEDIARVAEALIAQPETLILGCRDFGSDVPLRSRFGNVLTRGIMHALLGQKLTDTQTGLRGIPASFLPRLLRLESTGYEFELQMLIAAHELALPISAVSIRTIYEEGNKSSHFNPIRDSMKIYFVLLRFGSVSLLTALLDNLVFYLAWHRSANILVSQVIGRVAAVCFNYTMVRRSVFYSHQRHKTVLPKYLLLVVVSGAASYGGIRFLNQRLGVSPVSAKLLVETILFFANFAVQRLFIFKPQEGDAGEQPAAPVLAFSALAAAVFAVLLGAEIHGLATAHLFSQEIWFPVGLKRFSHYTGAYLALAAPVLVLVPWSFAGLMTVLLAVLTAVSVGPQPLLACGFFLISACALGCRLLGASKLERLQQHMLATLLGIGGYIFLMTPLARTPVHYPLVWGVVLAVPIATDLRGVWERLVYWASLLRRAELRSWGERGAFALLVFFVVAQWFVALKPETSADGLAMHLAVAMNIASHHAMTYEPARFLWSVMPMGADWAYSIVYLLGGEYAARILNFAMLLIVLALLLGATRRWISPSAAFLIAASFAGTALAQLVTGSLFVENFLAAMVLGLVVAIWRFGESAQKRFLYLAMFLGGTAMSIKFGALAYVAVALPFAIGEMAAHWKLLGRRPAAVCALALLLLVATAAPTYAIAYYKTGNPIFPFNNRKLHSPLLDPSVDVNDSRFHTPIDWTTLYRMTFQTNEAYEGQNGSFGFQYLVVAPFALIGLLVVARRPAILAATVAVGARLMIMRSQPNVRYLYAAMPLLMIPFAALLAWMHTNQRWLYRTLLVFLAASAGLNAWFLPSASYYHKDFCLRLPFSRAERERYKQEATPVRAVIAWYNQHHPNSAVLLTRDSTLAGLEGDVYANHWHQYTTLEELRHAFTLPDMLALLRKWKVEYLIAQKPSAGEPLRPLALKQLLDRCAAPEFEMGDYYLARLDPGCNPVVSLVAQPGFYDDFDPVISYRGDWYHDDSFEGPGLHTITYTDTPDAEIAFAFTGQSLTYAFTKAPNRGIAALTVDGEGKGTVDLYSPRIEWQTERTFCCFSPGRHLVVIRVTGQSNPASSGKFVDLDSFTVR